MTKKKAIEEAVDAGWDAYTYTSEDCETMADGMDRLASVSAECAYELGRIAGLREAARDMERGYDDPEADEAALAVNEALDELALQLRSRANALARKVRTK